MSKYVIITDAAAALLPQQCEDLEIIVVPMGAQLGDKHFEHYPDCREMNLTDFYNGQRNGELSGTTAVNPDVWMRAIEPALKDGFDALVIPFSSGLSSTCENAFIAAAELRSSYPGQRIEVVDSKSADFGQGLFVADVARNRANGMSFEDNAKWCVDNRLSYCSWFTVDDLHHLKRGGRVSAATAVVGSALGIKPILHVDDDGLLISVGKVRGRKKSLVCLIEKVGELAIRPETQVMHVCHADSPDEVNFVADELKRRYNVKDVIINYTAPISGAHSGPGTMALFFVGRNR